MAKQQNNQVQVPGYLKISKVIVWALYFYIIIGIVSLTLRIFLLLFSANSAAGFYNLVIRVSSDYLQPFRGIFPTKPVGETGYLDISSLFAIIVYLFILWGVGALVQYTQNKIDITKAEQEKQLEQLRQDKLLEEQRAARAQAAANKRR
ncbi:YggT family protein [Candidatus Saccharibacteria bacterium]|nr:YggT family protein [Candidatus Saccharibacteria bacterium]